MRIAVLGTGMVGQLNLHEPGAPEQVGPSRAKRGVALHSPALAGAKRKRISLLTYQRRNRYTR